MALTTALVKYIVFLLNLVCAVAGLALMVIGIYYKLSFDEYVETIAEDNLSLTLTLIIVLGVIVFVIAFFGCCGAISEKPTLLVLYAVLLLILLILQIALGVYGFLQYEDELQIMGTFKSEFLKTFEYPNNTNSRSLIDIIQHGFKCCGVDGPGDWEIWNHGKILPSCCAESGTCKADDAFNEGCFEAVWTFIKDSIGAIEYVVLAIVILELLGVVIAFCLSSSIKNKEEKRKLLEG